MPRLVHRQVTTIQIVSVEVTWADDENKPAAETSTLIRHRRKSGCELKDVREEKPLNVTLIKADDDP
jgi:hypothetical protein